MRRPTKFELVVNRAKAPVVSVPPTLLATAEGPGLGKCKNFARAAHCAFARPRGRARGGRNRVRAEVYRV